MPVTELRHGWILIAAGAVLVVIGAVRAFRRLRDRPRSRAIVTGRDHRGRPLIGHGRLDPAETGLAPGDGVAVRPDPRHPDAVTACRRPTDVYWAGLLAYGALLCGVGAHALANFPPLPLPFAVLMSAVGTVFPAMPFLTAGKAIGLLAFVIKGTRVRGRAIEFRAHPTVRSGRSPAYQMRVGYEYRGFDRSAWSPTSYTTPWGQGRAVSAWVDDRHPGTVLTFGAYFPALLIGSWIAGSMGLPFLLGPLLLG